MRFMWKPCCALVNHGEIPNFLSYYYLVKKQTDNALLSCDTMLGSPPFYQIHMRVPEGTEIHKKGTYFFSSRGLPPHPWTEEGSYTTTHLAHMNYAMW